MFIHLIGGIKICIENLIRNHIAFSLETNRFQWIQDYWNSFFGSNVTHVSNAYDTYFLPYISVY